MILKSLASYVSFIVDKPPITAIFDIILQYWIDMQLIFYWFCVQEWNFIENNKSMYKCIFLWCCAIGNGNGTLVTFLCFGVGNIALLTWSSGVGVQNITWDLLIPPIFILQFCIWLLVIHIWKMLCWAIHFLLHFSCILRFFNVLPREVLLVSSNRSNQRVVKMYFLVFLVAVLSW